MNRLMAKMWILGAITSIWCFRSCDVCPLSCHPFTPSWWVTDTFYILPSVFPCSEISLSLYSDVDVPGSNPMVAGFQDDLDPDDRVAPTSTLPVIPSKTITLSSDEEGPISSVQMTGDEDIDSELYSWWVVFVWDLLAWWLIGNVKLQLWGLGLQLKSRQKKKWVNYLLKQRCTPPSSGIWHMLFPGARDW